VRFCFFQVHRRLVSAARCLRHPIIALRDSGSNRTWMANADSADCCGVNCGLRRLGMWVVRAFSLIFRQSALLTAFDVISASHYLITSPATIQHTWSRIAVDKGDDLWGHATHNDRFVDITLRVNSGSD